MAEPVLVSVLSRSVVAATPLLLATLGEIVCEWGGVLNLGIEGMMSVGAVAGFATALASGNPWLGLLAAGAAGMALAARHGLCALPVRGNLVIAGLALAMLGLGLSGLLGKGCVGVPLPATARLGCPWPETLQQLPLAGPLLFSYDALTYLTLALLVVLTVLLERGRWGLWLRACGENPQAARAAGIPVARVRFLAVLVGGWLAGWGGAHLSLAYNPTWIEGMVGGRGWMVVALTIFARWTPRRALYGAWLVGVLDVAQFPLQARLGVPPNFLKMLPYLATIAVLAYSAATTRRRGEAPAALGEPLP